MKDKVIQYIFVSYFSLAIYIDDISLIQNEDGVVEVSGTWLEEQVSALITANLPASGEEVSY